MGTRFSTTQRNALGPVYLGNSVTPTLINGNGAYTNKPALEQDGNFPMSAALTTDRYGLWKTSNTPPGGANGVKLDIDLGADRTIYLISLHGIRCGAVAEGLVPKPLTWHAAYRTAAQGYDGAASFTDFASAATAAFGGKRDSLIEGAGEVFRYLRLQWSDATTSPFGLGRIFVGTTPDVDFGMNFSPGSGHDVVTPSLVTDNMAMGPVVTVLGETHEEFDLVVDSITDSVMNQIDLLRRTRQSFIYYRHTGTVHECIISGMRLKDTQTFGPPARYSVALNLLALA